MIRTASSAFGARHLRVALAACALSLAAGCGAEDSGLSPPKAGEASLRPEGGSAIGLGYGQTRELSVRLRDGDDRPVAGARVGFVISGEAAGSTLSDDRDVTSDNGVASVVFTAGAGEASFRVIASTTGATEAVFDVAISRFAFVALAARLNYTGAGMGSVAHVDADLYDDRPCARLRPEASPPAPLRTQRGAGPAALLHFESLRALGYAVVARALDRDDRLVAWGCVDVQAAARAGGEIYVPVPLERVLPAPAGAFLVNAVLALPPRSLEPWESLAACGGGLAQPLLDEIVLSLGPGAVADGIALGRGAPDAAGCRPTTRGGMPTLDGALVAVLTDKGSAGALFAEAVRDVQALAGSAQVQSRLTLSESGAGPDRFVATHVIERVAFAGAGGGRTAAFDPAALGFPVTTASGLSLSVEDGAIRVPRHVFTLRLPALWSQAIAEVALAPRALPADARQLVAAAVAGARRGSESNGNFTGCPAVEDLILSIVAGPRGALARACEQAAERYGARLAAALVPTKGYDMSIALFAVPADDDGDLRVDRFADGEGEVDLVLAGNQAVHPRFTFSATREAKK